MRPVLLEEVLAGARKEAAFADVTLDEGVVLDELLEEIVDLVVVPTLLEETEPSGRLELTEGVDLTVLPDLTVPLVLDEPLVLPEDVDLVVVPTLLVEPEEEFLTVLLVLGLLVLTLPEVVPVVLPLEVPLETPVEFCVALPLVETVPALLEAEASEPLMTLIEDEDPSLCT